MQDCRIPTDAGCKTQLEVIAPPLSSWISHAYFLRIQQFRHISRIECPFVCVNFICFICILNID